MANETEFNGFELNVNEIIAGKVAEMAIEKIPQETLESMTNRVLEKFHFDGRKYFSYELTPFEKKVLDKFYTMIGKSVEKYMEEEKDIEQEANNIAERIVKNAREAAEVYMTEQIAYRMCICASDFNGIMRKCDISTIVYNAMNNHLKGEHIHQ